MEMVFAVGFEITVPKELITPYIEDLYPLISERVKVGVYFNENTNVKTPRQYRKPDFELENWFQLRSRRQDLTVRLQSLYITEGGKLIVGSVYCMNQRYWAILYNPSFTPTTLIQTELNRRNPRYRRVDLETPLNLECRPYHHTIKDREHIVKYS